MLVVGLPMDEVKLMLPFLKESMGLPNAFSFHLLILYCSLFQPSIRAFTISMSVSEKSIRFLI
jgi:hypothetical protein